jgi:hypothetical protein
MQGHHLAIQQLSVILLKTVHLVKFERLATRDQERSKVLRAERRRLAFRQLLPDDVIHGVIAPDVIHVGTLWDREILKEKKELVRTKNPLDGVKNSSSKSKKRGFAEIKSSFKFSALPLRLTLTIDNSRTRKKKSLMTYPLSRNGEPGAAKYLVRRLRILRRFDDALRIGTPSDVDSGVQAPTAVFVRRVDHSSHLKTKVKTRIINKKTDESGEAYLPLPKSQPGHEN